MATITAIIGVLTDLFKALPIVKQLIDLFVKTPQEKNEASDQADQAVQNQADQTGRP